MNDSRELHDGIEILLSTLKNIDAKDFHDEEYFEDAVKYINGSLADTVSYGIYEDPIYIFSLAKAENQLSQWRSYGQYAIEFCENELWNQLGFLHSCTYKISDKRRISQSALVSAIRKMCIEMDQNEGKVGISGLGSIVSLIEIAASFKDKGFYEEKEIRIIMCGGEREIKYRPRDNILIPYIEIDIPLECVKKIHVGPMNKQELAYESMRCFALDAILKWRSNGGDVDHWLEVEKSDIPYRE